MAPTDRIRVQHAESGGVIEITREQFDVVYSKNGWSEVDPATPLTDQRYTAEGGGEPQPAPPVAPDTESEPGVGTAAATGPTAPQPAPTE